MSGVRNPAPVLLWDEDPARLALWTSAAPAAGLDGQLRPAGSAEEARRHLGSEDFRQGSPLLLLTLHPAQAVYDFLEWVRAERLRRRSLIVALIPSGATAHVSRLYDLGVHSCLTAPHTAEEARMLLSSIRQYWDVLNVPPVRTA
ncbi:MAG TPA: hypothetical protein VEJ18_11600 [Planctomycetota bacterium]|nr:hypothetical protein [Planctomycetota bacterium]